MQDNDVLVNCVNWFQMSVISNIQLIHRWNIFYSKSDLKSYDYAFAMQIVRFHGFEAKKDSFLFCFLP